MTAPFLPDLSKHDKLDTSAFDKNITNQEAAMTMLPKSEADKLK
jgi:hypothetical protein